MKPNRLLPVILLILTGSFSGCESLIDCIVASARPNLEQRELPSCQRFAPYNETLAVAMENVPTGDYYILGVETNGNFPDGMACTAEGMEVHLTGMPVDFGTYEFSILVTVKAFNEDEEGHIDLCSSVSKRSYLMSVTN